MLRFDGTVPQICVGQATRPLAAGESCTVSSNGLDYTLVRSTDDEVRDFEMHDGGRALGAALALGALVSMLAWSGAAAPPLQDADEQPAAAG